MKQLEIGLLMELFKANPGIAARFYKFVANKFSSLIRNFGKEKDEKGKTENLDLNKSFSYTESETQSERMDDTNSARELNKKDPNYILVKKFDLEPTEILIKSVECSIKEAKSLKAYGTLFITTRYLCYEASVLGMVSKEVIAYQKLKEIKIKNGKLYIYTKKKKVAFYIEEEKDALELENLITGLKDKINSEGEPIKKKNQKM